MPRPTDLDPTWLRECEEAFDASDSMPDFMKRMPAVREMMLEVWCSGVWLKGLLIERGCSEELVEQIGFAHGQRCLGRDPWDVAATALDQYDAGEFTPPGLALAAELLGGAPLTIQPVAE